MAMTNPTTNNQQPTTNNQPLIELKKISKTFGNSVVLDEIDLNIYPGRSLAIIGPSGTGKSTILRIIAGLMTPDRGEIYVGGQKRHRSIEDSPDLIAISMVFQHAALFDSLTVEENVGFTLFQHSNLDRKTIRRLVEEKLAMVGLSGIGDRYPAQLSGGMQKRVSFARAIMSNPYKPEDNPDVILYDEPTAGLDPIASTVIEDLVRNLQQRKNTCGTYVMVTHQESTIRRTADCVAFLYGGKLKWQGSVDEIDRTDNPLVRQFFSASREGPIQVAG